MARFTVYYDYVESRVAEVDADDLEDAMSILTAMPQLGDMEQTEVVLSYWREEDDV